jgi:outer membrane protein assembly factor BamA
MLRSDAFPARAARGVRIVAAALVLVPAVALAAAPEPVPSLGRLERESVEEALALLGLTIDVSPEGKVIGHVYVVNQEVFSRHDWRLQFFNVFHRTTRPDIIQRELLLAPGQRWDATLADESVRNLQAPPPLFFANGTRFAAPQLSSVVAIVPVVSPVSSTVDVLAVTRDLWSLRFNTDFQFQKNTLSLLQTSLSENNLFGWRKYLAAGFELDQGRYGVGPTFFDPNVAGTRLTLLGTRAMLTATKETTKCSRCAIRSSRWPAVGAPGWTSVIRTSSSATSATTGFVG